MAISKRKWLDIESWLGWLETHINHTLFLFQTIEIEEEGNEADDVNPTSFSFQNKIQSSLFVLDYSLSLFVVVVTWRYAWCEELKAGESIDVWQSNEISFTCRNDKKVSYPGKSWSNESFGWIKSGCRSGRRDVFWVPDATKTDDSHRCLFVILNSFLLVLTLVPQSLPVVVAVRCFVNLDVCPVRVFMFDSFNPSFLLMVMISFWRDFPFWIRCPNEGSHEERNRRQERQRMRKQWLTVFTITKAKVDFWRVFCIPTDTSSSFCLVKYIPDANVVL